MDRRGWQVLATLAGRPSARWEIAGALAAFDGPEVVDAVVGELRSRRSRTTTTPRSSDCSGNWVAAL